MREIKASIRERNEPRQRIRRDVVARIAVLILVGGCASASTSKVTIHTPANPNVLGFGRVLVAGFLPDGSNRIDLNQETARFLRARLRSTTSLVIVESEPLQLADSQQDDAIFTNVSFWKTLGEEHSEPLILTGLVRFSPAGPRMEERQVGRRTLRLWFRGFSLRLRLVLISGKTGEIVDSVPLRQLIGHATTGRESDLSIYFRLMAQAMPSVVGILGQQTTQTRVLLK